MDRIETELDLSTLSVADLEGDGTPPPGKYHVKIESVKRVSAEASYLNVRLLILAGTNKDGVGCLFSERLYLSDKAIKRVAILAHRLKLIAGDDLGDRKTVDWSAAIGRQLVVEVIEEEFEKRDGSKAKRAKLSFAGFWAIDDARVAAVPKDEAALKSATTAKPKVAKPSGDVGSFEDI